jgi:hypothetical protein
MENGAPRLAHAPAPSSATFPAFREETTMTKT